MPNMKDDKQKPADLEPKEPPTEPAKKKDDAAAQAKSSYVFKIVPANPKNALDFEDVADK